MAGFVILIVLFGAAWLLFVMPARRRRMSHSAMQDSVGEGDEIITAGGLHGVVKALEGETLQLEIAPGVVVTLDQRAVAAVARDIEVEVDAPVAELEEAESGEAEHGGGAERLDGQPPQLG